MGDLDQSLRLVGQCAGGTAGDERQRAGDGGQGVRSSWLTDATSSSLRRSIAARALQLTIEPLPRAAQLQLIGGDACQRVKNPPFPVAEMTWTAVDGAQAADAQPVMAGERCTGIETQAWHLGYQWMIEKPAVEMRVLDDECVVG